MIATARAILIGLFLLICATSAHACSKDLPAWALHTCNRLDQIWTQGNQDIYLSGYSWHNRSTYSPEKIHSFNELAWGGGYGRSLYDEDGDWQGIYAMAFLDSHSKVEPVAGYAFLKIGHLSQHLRAGAGYTVFLTARHDIFHYIPFPGALPLVSLGYKETTLYATYIPGAKGAGNVLFMFGRWRF